MKNQWNQYKLRDVLTLQYGEGLSKNKRIPGEYPVYGSGGIVGYHKESLIKGPGIIVGRKGSIGTVFYEKKDFYPIDTVFYVELKSSQYNLRYIYYLLVQSNLKNLNTDAAVPGLNREVAHSQIVKIPDFLLQRKISSILSAYDDLIENNTRRIKILEEMAQRLYREWFVDFRFPGHKKVKFVDSELGKIPEGWEVKSFFGIPSIRLISENVLPYEGVKRYFATADVEGIDFVKDGIEYTYPDKPSRAQKQPILNSVWFARMKDTYKVLLFSTKNSDFVNSIMLSSGFVGFEAVLENWLSFLFISIKSAEFHQQKDLFCTGATQMSLTNEGLARIKWLFPKDDIVYEFDKIVHPIIDLILVYQRRNKILRQTRDLLLPKLISGELDVSGLDIKIGEEQ